jgi:hypothetical protein
VPDAVMFVTQLLRADVGLLHSILFPVLLNGTPKVDAAAVPVPPVSVMVGAEV